jgi:N-ethylmaleimide reductase
MSKGREILAHSAIKLTDRCGQTQKLQDLVVPKEMTLQNIIHAKTEFVCAAENEFMRALMMSNCTRQTDIIRGILSPVSNIRKSDFVVAS